jgi:hypothetical protein
MVWHIWSFAAVTFAGILLSIMTYHAWKTPKMFYFTYELIILMIFVCELPFIYIINKIVSQGIKSRERDEMMARKSSSVDSDS